MALEAAQPADHVLGPERGAQYPPAVELLKPLAILHVALASRHVAHMTCIDQVDFDAGSFKLLVERYPVNARRLHRRGGDATGFQPLDQDIQPLSKSTEAAYTRFAGLHRLRWHGHIVFSGAAINAAGMRVDPPHLLFALLGF